MPARRLGHGTSGLSPEATELANRLAEQIEKLDVDTVRRMLALLDGKGEG